MKITIARFSPLYQPQMGVLSIDGTPSFLTLEPPYIDNKRNISCIPVGTYTCVKRFKRKVSAKLFLEETFEVLNVKDRSGILFHPGNTVKDTKGCILLGMSFSSTEYMILSSTKAYESFMYKLENVDEFELRIIDARGHV